MNNKFEASIFLLRSYQGNLWKTIGNKTLYDISIHNLKLEMEMLLRIKVIVTSWRGHVPANKFAKVYKHNNW